ncbi:MAG: hypothetical protein K2J06_03745, partial [Muribaculaceae bacterium]|nr:hypothetical protein [Muribaculaceae bacterium]
LYPCPEAVAKTIALRTLLTRGLEIVSAGFSPAVGNSCDINLMMQYEWMEPDEDATYSLRGTVWTVEGNPRSIGTFSLEMKYSSGGLDRNFILATVTTDIFGITESTKLRLEWTVYSSKRPNQPVNSGTINMY